MKISKLFGGRKAAILYLGRFYSTMTRPIDGVPEDRVPLPDKMIVKKGDNVRNVLVIKRVTKQKLTFVTNAMFASDGKAGKSFSVSRGETVSLTQIDILDASFSVNLTYLDENI